jgi:hypothetical protein
MPKTEFLIQVIFTILSVAGRGNIHAIPIFLQHPPYIQFKSRIPLKYKKVFQKFSSFVQSITKITIQLTEIKFSTKTLSTSQSIQNKVAKAVIENGFTMKDKIECIKNTNENHKLLTDFPEDLKNLLLFAQEFKEIILRLTSEVLVSPYSDLLLQRSIQCISANERAPSIIVQKFWPVC